MIRDGKSTQLFGSVYAGMGTLIVELSEVFLILRFAKISILDNR